MIIRQRRSSRWQLRGKAWVELAEKKERADDSRRAYKSAYCEIQGLNDPTG
jgi:hypothetical protein